MIFLPSLGNGGSLSMAIESEVIVGVTHGYTTFGTSLILGNAVAKTDFVKAELTAIVSANPVVTPSNQSNGIR